MVPKITLHREQGSWHACKDGAPSTWILKRGGRPTEVGGDIIDTEVACLALARAVGLTTIDAQVLDFGEVRGIAVSRYDRDGHLGREHQEDLAQAIGLNTSDPNRKFQWGSAMPSLRDAATVLRDGGANQDPLLRLVAFSLVVGNTDMHAKNISFLRHADGRVDLSPAYDIAMHLHHRPDDRRNALDVNGKFLVDEITIEEVVAEGVGWGLPARRAERVVSYIVEAVRVALVQIDRSAHPHVSAQAWAVVDRRTQEAADRLPASQSATRRTGAGPERASGGAAERQPAAQPQVGCSTVPCCTHVAVQAPGVTCTFIRRRQCTQKRGGSSSARRAQRAWPPSATASPHCPHHCPIAPARATGPTASSPSTKTTASERLVERLDRHLELVEQREVLRGVRPSVVR